MKAVCRGVSRLIVMSALSGCAMYVGSAANNEVTQTYAKALLKLRMGLDERQVRQLLGPPGTSEFYRSLDGSPVLVYHYRAPGKIPSPKTTSLFFESGQLMMWGNNFYE